MGERSGVQVLVQECVIHGQETYVSYMDRKPGQLEEFVPGHMLLAY